MNEKDELNPPIVYAAKHTNDNVVKNRISYANKVNDIIGDITPTDINFIILAKGVKRRKKW